MAGLSTIRSGAACVECVEIREDIKYVQHAVAGEIGDRVPSVERIEEGEEIEDIQHAIVREIRWAEMGGCQDERPERVPPERADPDDLSGVVDTGRGAEHPAGARIGSQLDINEKRKRADWVIDNTGDREQTRAQVSALVATLSA